MKHNSSYNKMITKLMLTGISETQYPMLASGPLTDSKSSGITKIASRLIQEHSSYMAEEGPVIWDEIAKIKVYVEKRNSIDEKKMYTEEESQKLLKTTEDVQNILEHISEQEEKFITLTDIVNKNIYNIFNQYIELSANSEQVISKICQKVGENTKPPLTKEHVNEEDIIKATSTETLNYIVADLKIGSSTGINIIDYATEQFDIETYDGLILLQAWIIMCYRFDVLRMGSLDMSMTFDYKDAMEKILAQRELASEILDIDDLESAYHIEETEKLNELKQELTENLNINSDYTHKLINELEELIILTEQREPKEIEELESDANQEAA
ncbi:MAG: hypothetical protein VX112_04920 [Pseudomonadota bacterium]|nr:hypothetical protein [Pseudomonadota bacterium]